MRLRSPKGSSGHSENRLDKPFGKLLPEGWKLITHGLKTVRENLAFPILFSKISNGHAECSFEGPSEKFSENFERFPLNVQKCFKKI